jgi:rod shape determining protein RodA
MTMPLSTTTRSLLPGTTVGKRTPRLWRHIDPPLLYGLGMLIALGLGILYSASAQSLIIVEKQTMRILLAAMVMLIFSQIPPRIYYFWIPWFFLVGVVLLVLVLLLGDISKGAQRWLNLGFMRFQPSELMRLVVPAMVAWYLSDKELPPTLSQLGICAVLILVPVLLIAKQPDLGTAILILLSGSFVIFLAGISWKIIASLSTLAAAVLPLFWYVLHDYQRQRILTFLNPESDPLGSGYNIIQSKIAIGSGGVFGKGWFNGSQAYLQFLPEHSTDFIFAVYSEEFGLLGALVLLLIYSFIIIRGFYISTQAQDSFTRLFAGGLVLTFAIYILINIGMVCGVLPVVGIPLPLVSYGGTSIVTLLASFGILMSIHTHRKLVGT